MRFSQHKMFDKAFNGRWEEGDEPGESLTEAEHVVAC